MNINQCQIDELVKLVGEDILKEIIPDAFLLKYNPSKLYVFDTYKLHRIDNGFAWIDMTTTNCYANGIGGFEDMIKRAGNKLFIFNNLEEYIRWAYKCLEK